MLKKLKKRKGLFAAAACAVVASWVSVTLAAFPEPGDVVNKSNMDKAQDVLTPTAEWMIKQGMVMKVGPYKKYEWPKAYKEATEKYAGQVKLSEDGRQLFNYVAGCPFPSIDINAPLAGSKVMWNHEYFPDFTDNVGCPWILELVNNKGEMERFYASHFWRRMKWEGRLYMDPKPVAPHNPQLTYTEQWGPLYAPNDLKGAGVLNFRYSPLENPDDSYMYLPELRRVRRMSVANRSDAFWGTDIDIDSIWAFNAKPGYWTWRVLGEKQVLMAAHSGHYQDRDVWGAAPDGKSGTMAFLWSDKVNWEKRPVWVIEGIPTGYNQYAYSKRVLYQYAYSKRVMYIDKEYFNTSWSETYDHDGELWKTWTQLMNISKRPSAEYLAGNYDEEQVFTHNGQMLDMQIIHSSKWDCPPGYKEYYVLKYDWYFNTAKEWNTPDTFTINFLIQSAH